MLLVVLVLCDLMKALILLYWLILLTLPLLINIAHCSNIDSRTNCQVGQFSCKMTLKGGSSAACAACKHQRRRCKPDCALAPYFPPDQQEIFQCVHRLFGVSKILRILEELNDNQKAEAMQAIKYESYIRGKDPVRGCLGIIRNLEYRMMCYQEELQAVIQQLALHKEAQYQHVSPMAAPDDSRPSQLELGMPTPPSKNVVSAVYNVSPQACGVPFSNNVVTNIPLGTTGYDMEGIDHQEHENQMWDQQHNNYNSNVCESSMAENQLIAPQQQPQQLPIQQQVGQGYDDQILPFSNAIDERQPYKESKEANCDPRLDESMENTTHSMKIVGEKDLRNAAVRLSLTRVN